jgi:hypothetical protein
MMKREKDLEWLHHRTEEHHSKEDNGNGLVEDLREDDKLGQGFSSIDMLEEMDIGDWDNTPTDFCECQLDKGTERIGMMSSSRVY